MGGTFAQIGDSLVLTKDVAAFATIRAWTGTTVPYAIYRVHIHELATTEGSIKIMIYAY
jgi:hypothetical protein